MKIAWALTPIVLIAIGAFGFYGGPRWFAGFAITALCVWGFIEKVRNPNGAMLDVLTPTPQRKPAPTPRTIKNVVQNAPHNFTVHGSNGFVRTINAPDGRVHAITATGFVLAQDNGRFAEYDTQGNLIRNY